MTVALATAVPYPVVGLPGVALMWGPVCLDHWRVTDRPTDVTRASAERFAHAMQCTNVDHGHVDASGWHKRVAGVVGCLHCEDGSFASGHYVCTHGAPCDDCMDAGVSAAENIAAGYGANGEDTDDEMYYDDSSSNYASCGWDGPIEY
jgi:hypothetical protein